MSKKENVVITTPIERLYSSEEGGHPFGVQPFGNYFFNQLSASATQSSSGSDIFVNPRSFGLGKLSIYKDDQIISLLGYLKVKDLCKLANVSKACYIFAHFDDCWKALVLGRWEGKFSYYKDWKQTYRKSLSIEKHNIQLLDPIQQPIEVKDFYSDILFHYWMCARLPIDSRYLQNNNIERISIKNTSLNDFVSNYDVPNRPVIICDALAAWPAMEAWNPDDRFLETYGNVTFNANGYYFKLCNYYDYAKSVTDDQILLLFDKKFCEVAPSMINDFIVPSYFKGGDQDLFSLLNEERPDFRWLIIGPQRSGSTFHQDPNGTSAWNAVISGSKKWIFYPPSVIPPGVQPSIDGADVATTTSPMEWFLNYYPHACEAPLKERPLEAVVNAGEIMYVPAGWWHLVLNTAPGMTVAITQNFVSKANVVDVLKFLKNKTDQISGCKTDDAKLSLYTRLASTLQLHRPSLWHFIEEKLNRKRRRTALLEAFDIGNIDNNDKGNANSGFQFGFNFSG